MNQAGKGDFEAPQQPLHAEVLGIEPYDHAARPEPRFEISHAENRGELFFQPIGNILPVSEQGMCQANPSRGLAANLPCGNRPPNACHPDGNPRWSVEKKILDIAIGLLNARLFGGWA